MELHNLKEKIKTLKTSASLKKESEELIKLYVELEKEMFIEEEVVKLRGLIKKQKEYIYSLTSKQIDIACQTADEIDVLHKRIKSREKIIQDQFKELVVLKKACEEKNLEGDVKISLINRNPSENDLLLIGKLLPRKSGKIVELLLTKGKVDIYIERHQLDKILKNIIGSNFSIKIENYGRNPKN